MRDIKFRAWAKESRKWVTNNLEIDPMPTVEVMQYTGLKDKNGKEIYEGDIVQDAEDDTRTVVWGDDYPAFHLKPCVCEGTNCLMYAQLEGGIEVIGNVHENPELLATPNSRSTKNGE